MTLKKQTTNKTRTKHKQSWAPYFIWSYCSLIGLPSYRRILFSLVVSWIDDSCLGVLGLIDLRRTGVVVVLTDRCLIVSWIDESYLRVLRLIDLCSAVIVTLIDKR